MRERPERNWRTDETRKRGGNDQSHFRWCRPAFKDATRLRCRSKHARSPSRARRLLECIRFGVLTSPPRGLERRRPRSSVTPSQAHREVRPGWRRRRIEKTAPRVDAICSGERDSYRDAEKMAVGGTRADPPRMACLLSPLRTLRTLRHPLACLPTSYPPARRLHALRPSLKTWTLESARERLAHCNRKKRKQKHSCAKNAKRSVRVTPLPAAKALESTGRHPLAPSSPFLPPATYFPLFRLSRPPRAAWRRESKCNHAAQRAFTMYASSAEVGARRLHPPVLGPIAQRAAVRPRPRALGPSRGRAAEFRTNCSTLRGLLKNPRNEGFALAYSRRVEEHLRRIPPGHSAPQ